MKNAKIILLIGILASCSRQSEILPTQSTTVSLIDDRTDFFLLSPLPDPILRLFDFLTYRNQKAEFRLIPVTDKMLSPIQIVHIEDGNISELRNVNDQVDYRARLIRAFYRSVRKIISDANREHQQFPSLAHSECYATIAGELNYLCQSKTTRRYLIIYSDGADNSDSSFNPYSQKGLQLLLLHPDVVANLFLKRYPLPPDLTGIKICFLHNPVDRDDDLRFEAMVKVYRILLEARGAKVSIQASNNFEL